MSVEYGLKRGWISQSGQQVDVTRTIGGDVHITVLAGKNMTAKFPQGQARMLLEALQELMGETAKPGTTEQTWQPMETAPRDGTPILVCINMRGHKKFPPHFTYLHVCAWWASLNKWIVAFDNQDAEIDYEPAWWMPLPACPGAQDLTHDGDALKDKLAQQQKPTVKELSE